MRVDDFVLRRMAEVKPRMRPEGGSDHILQDKSDDSLRVVAA